MELHVLESRILSSSCQSTSQLIKGLIRGWLCTDSDIPEVTPQVTRQCKGAEETAQGHRVRKTGGGAVQLSEV